MACRFIIVGWTGDDGSFRLLRAEIEGARGCDNVGIDDCGLGEGANRGSRDSAGIFYDVRWVTHILMH
jgi:hypothetical protein